MSTITITIINTIIILLTVALVSFPLYKWKFTPKVEIGGIYIKKSELNNPFLADITLLKVYGVANGFVQYGFEKYGENSGKYTTKESYLRDAYVKYKG